MIKLMLINPDRNETLISLRQKYPNQSLRWKKTIKCGEIVDFPPQPKSYKTFQNYQRLTNYRLRAGI